jgi:hypothetical protein
MTSCQKRLDFEHSYSCVLRPHSPLTSPREIPQSQRLNRGLLATVKIFVRKGRYRQHCLRAELGTSLANQRLERVGCGWGISRSEVKGERQPQASAEDMSAVGWPKRNRLAQALARRKS